MIGAMVCFLFKAKDMIQIDLFKYDQIKQNDREFIQTKTNEIKILVKRSAQDIIDIGQKLIEVKDRLPHGMFGPWLSSEFGWTWKTATRFTNVALKFDNLSNLDEIAPSALYLLAAPSTPNEAREEAINQVNNGQTITHKMAKEIIQSHREIETSIVNCPSCHNLYDSEMFPSSCPYCYKSEQNLHGWINDLPQRIEEDNSPKLSQPMQVLLSHETIEYYTPPIYIEAAREVMGGIDLDPASCEAAQENIKASKFYTISDDGLSQEWHGSVWLNPPYSKTGGKSNQEIWAAKLAEEYTNKNVTEAVLLVKSALGYKWFENLWDVWPVCFARERLSFIKSDGTSDGQSKHGTAFFYFGGNIEKFERVFQQFGRVIIG